MYTTNPYCQLSDVKSQLNTVSTKDDTWITSLIPVAQQQIDNELGYSFQTDGTPSTPTTRYFDGNNTESLFTGWINQIVSVTEQIYTWVPGFVGNSLISTPAQDITLDCYIGPDNRSPGWNLGRLSQIPFSGGKRNYVVKAVFGIPTIPPDISRACTRLVVFMVKMRDTNYADRTIEQGGIRSMYLKSIPQDVMDILENYRLHFFYGR